MPDLPTCMGKRGKIDLGEEHTTVIEIEEMTIKTCCLKGNRWQTTLRVQIQAYILKGGSTRKKGQKEAYTQVVSKLPMIRLIRVTFSPHLEKSSRFTIQTK